jgi:hypothetical protein
MTRSGGVVAFLLAGLVAACATTPRAVATTAAAPAIPAADSEQTSDDGDDDADADDDPEVDSAPAQRAEQGPCPTGMALVDDSGKHFCIDKYEASLVETMADGSEHPFPHYLPVDGHDVRAVSVAGVFPQGYISEVQAQDACAASHKRLCKPDEWKVACAGPAHTTFPYGDARRPGTCHDTGKSAVLAVFGAKAVAASMPGPAIVAANARAHESKSSSSKKSSKSSKSSSSKKTAKSAAKTTTVASTRKQHHGKKSTRPESVDPGVWAKLNDPGLGQVEGALARTGDHAQCVNGFGVFDMVGNLHEWVATDASIPHGTFQGGYYLDTSLNGDGCAYRTVAHAHDYHDYSTGFRCCAESH